MYATKQDMIDRYGTPKLVQLTDLTTPHSGEIVDATLTARLVDASAEIDGYIMGRTPVPMLTPPAHIKLICCRLTHYLLLGDAATDVDRDDAKVARSYLMQVANGSVRLGMEADVPAITGAGDVQFEPGRKDWGRE